LTQESHFDQNRKIIGRIDIQVHVPSDFPEKYESAVIQTAGLCAVKRHLRDDIEMNISLIRP
jgi:ribosomal protein S12 methylthiotransferase accessory factor